MHIPVLLNQVLNYLDPQPGKNFIDATIGGGGHTWAILKKTSPHGQVLGIDNNPKAIEDLKPRIQELNLQKRLILVCDNFTHLKEIVKKNKFSPVNGILFDLGLSSDLIEKSKRGISFMRQEILDMRFNPQAQDLTAAKILNQFSKQELERIFKQYGGERFSQRIAEMVVEERKKQRIIMTDQLVRIIKKSLRKHFHIKSLARVFQSLRIVVNNELENLEKGLMASLEILSPQARIVVLSYHSLEDKIVKDFFKKQLGLKILTKKPLRPSQEEIKENSRARSAKLRASEKIK